jgi:hypothetical protein
MPPRAASCSLIVRPIWSRVADGRHAGFGQLRCRESTPRRRRPWHPRHPAPPARQCCDTRTREIDLVGGHPAPSAKHWHASTLGSHDASAAGTGQSVDIPAAQALDVDKRRQVTSD